MAKSPESALALPGDFYENDFAMAMTRIPVSLAKENE
jgi:hypothetical protein